MSPLSKMSRWMMSQRAKRVRKKRRRPISQSNQGYFTRLEQCLPLSRPIAKVADRLRIIERTS